MFTRAPPSRRAPAMHDTAITGGPDDAVTIHTANGTFQTVLDGPAPLDLGKTVTSAEFPTTVGLRFQALGIPRKSLVTDARIQFTAADNSDQDQSHFSID